jgi:hypothetical protein
MHTYTYTHAYIHTPHSHTHALPHTHTNHTHLHNTQHVAWLFVNLFASTPYIKKKWIRYNTPSTWALQAVFVKHGVTGIATNDILRIVTNPSFDPLVCAPNTYFMGKIDDLIINQLVCTH